MKLLSNHKLQFILLFIMLFTHMQPAKAGFSFLSDSVVTNSDSLMLTRAKKIEQTKSLNNGSQSAERQKSLVIFENADGFPSYISTGNPRQDDLDYKKRKLEWIKLNPEKYKKLNSPQPITESDQHELEKKLSEIKKNSRKLKE